MSHQDCLKPVNLLVAVSKNCILKHTFVYMANLRLLKSTVFDISHILLKILC